MSEVCSLIPTACRAAMHQLKIPSLMQTDMLSSMFNERMVVPTHKASWELLRQDMAAAFAQLCTPEVMQSVTTSPLDMQMSLLVKDISMREYDFALSVNSTGAHPFPLWHHLSFCTLMANNMNAVLAWVGWHIVVESSNFKFPSSFLVPYVHLCRSNMLHAVLRHEWLDNDIDTERNCGSTVAGAVSGEVRLPHSLSRGSKFATTATGSKPATVKSPVPWFGAAHGTSAAVLDGIEVPQWPAMYHVAASGMIQPLKTAGWEGDNMMLVPSYNYDLTSSPPAVAMHYESVTELARRPFALATFWISFLFLNSVFSMV